MPPIASIIEEIDHLQPISDIAGKVMKLLDDPDCGVSELSEIIRHEPALTANVLKVANSAYFGLPGKIEDAKQAVVYLGMTQVVDMVLLVSCSTHFKGTHDGYGLARGELWKSAVAGAILTNDLAEFKGLKRSALVFTGALLRDIGKVVIDQYVQTAMAQILNRVKTQAISFMAAERQVLGVDHSQVGAMVAQKWNFPPLLNCIVRYYHSPLEAKGCFTEASVVHLADAMCRKLKIGPGLDDPSYAEDERIAQSLGLKDAEIQGVIDRFGRKMERVQSIFEVI
jgi:HD-like signal output (HDOD) protein